MTAPHDPRGTSAAVDFFAIEANELLGQLDATLAHCGGEGPRGPDAESFVRLTRGLRGAATMARQQAIAELASAMERIAIGVRDRSIAWVPHVSDAIVAALDGGKALVRTVRSPGAADTARAQRLVDELRRIVPSDAPAAPGTPAAPAATVGPSASTASSAATASRGADDGRAGTAGVVPIARLYYDDDGPHVVHRDPQPRITADLRFRQAAVPLASSLRRLIGEARASGTDDGAQRTIGADLRAALADLGELAASYGITPVVNFANARADALARLDARALEVVDGAAHALVESAGVTWTRSTPTAPIDAIPPARATEAAPAAAAPVAPVAPAPAPAPDAVAEPETRSDVAPASGHALAALIETSLSNVDGFGLVDATERPGEAAGAPADLADGPPAAERDSVPDESALPSIDDFLYRGAAALERAKEVRDALRRSPAPDPILLAELYDLVDLAALDEPTHA